MLKKFLLFLILILLVGIFITPKNILAKDTYWPLKESETENILDIIRKFPLTESNRELFFNSLSETFSEYPRKTGAVVLVKQVILNEQFNYWFKRMPKQISKRFIKTIFRIIPLFQGQIIPEILNIIEKQSAKEASDYIINWLLKNEIRIGTGKAHYIFNSYKDNRQEIEIPYIILYKPKNEIEGEIIAEFYSNRAIEPPRGTGPNAIGRNKDNPRTNLWPHDRWIENEKWRNNDGKLEPFIVRIKGFLYKNKYGYEWDKRKSSPLVEIDFDNPVPEIEESDIILEKRDIGIKIDFIKEKIVKPAIKELNSIKNLITNKVNLIKKGISSFIESTKSLFSSQHFEAEIGKNIKKTREKTKIQLDIQEKDNELEELIEEYDNLLEEVDLLLAEIEKKQSDKNEEKEDRIDNNYDQRNDESKDKDEKEEEEDENEDDEDEEDEDEDDEDEDDEDDEEEEEIVFCSFPNNQISSRDIIINEIAWMGTLKSSNDEWIELKNISNKPINLENWQIIDEKRQIEISLGNTILEPGKFFLLERTDDTSVSNIAADLIYTGSLSNTNEKLYLFDNNCSLKDKAEANPNWLKGDNSSKKTMERKEDLSWQTSLSPGGTPKKENSSGEIIDHHGGGGTGGENKKKKSSKPKANPLLSEIIITEIQIGNSTSTDNDFIELYNPASTSIDLSGIQLKKKSSTGNSYSVRLFPDNSHIPAKGYFLWANSQYNNVSADVISSQTLSKNNSVALFNNNKIIDQIGWGSSTNPYKEKEVFPENPANNQTLGRKFINNKYVDNNNNLEDFQLQIPTPKKINQKFINSTSSEATSTNATSTNATSTNATSTEATSTRNYSIRDVVINEIAWMGTKAHHTDEWIELYNNTNNDINLENWKLSWNENIVNLTGYIPSYDFYLLERTASSTISDINEDKIYSGGLNNEGENIKLYDSNNNLIDEVDCSQGWIAGNNENKQSMERKNPYIAGTNQENWADNNTIKINGYDAEGNQILGTPKTKNSVFKTAEPNTVLNFKIIRSTPPYNKITLSWSTTTDPDTPSENLSYYIYRQNQEITTSTIDSAFSTSTASSSINLDNLNYNSSYYFAIRAFDGENYSNLSTTTPYNTPCPPIENLSAIPSAKRGSVDLFWKSPEKASSYIIKIVENATTSEKISWDNALTIENTLIPHPNEIEHYLIENLNLDKDYYFALKTVNSKGSTSSISNISSAKPLVGFRSNKDNTLTDLFTGLTWPENLNSLPTSSVSQKEAKAIASQLIMCGNGTFSTSTASSTCSDKGGIKYDDWRIPNYKELSTIVEYYTDPPHIIDKFTNGKPVKYWGSNKIKVSGGGLSGPIRYKAPILDLATGRIMNIKYSKLISRNYKILPVRGEELSDGFNNNLNITDNNDETITDNRTGLMWTKIELKDIGYKDPASNVECGVSWESAFNESQKEHFGYSDWRLPNITELQIIGGIPYGINKSYWSSTPDYNNPNKFWGAQTKGRWCGTCPINLEHYLRLVREIP